MEFYDSMAVFPGDSSLRSFCIPFPASRGVGDRDPSEITQSQYRNAKFSKRHSNRGRNEPDREVTDRQKSDYLLPRLLRKRNLSQQATATATNPESEDRSAEQQE